MVFWRVPVGRQGASAIRDISQGIDLCKDPFDSRIFAFVRQRPKGVGEQLYLAEGSGTAIPGYGYRLEKRKLAV
ncbi:MAG: hypothetical protein ACKO9Q_10775, partial [Pirellula sp.]